MFLKWNGVPAIFHFGSQGLPQKDPAQKPQNPEVCFSVGMGSCHFSFWEPGISPMKDSAQKPQSPMVVFSVVGGFVSGVGLEGGSNGRV